MIFVSNQLYFARAKSQTGHVVIIEIWFADVQAQIIARKAI